MSSPFPPDRPNPSDLVPFDQARAAVLERLRPLPAREVPLGEALGCVLAEDVTAAEDLPPFANSAMDGFAVRAADLAGASEQAPVDLRVSGEVFAGSGRLPTVRPGAAARIMTGGPLPPGADAVVPIEQATVDGDAVHIRLAPGERQFVREAGEDVRAGTVVLERGRPVDPAAVGMLASVGRRLVPVHPRPRVAVVSTDDPEALRRGFALAAAEGDLVLTSGGVSVGERDYTKQVLAELGDVRGFRVAMQPGMPQAFGFAAGSPLYGLPGNPVSCFVVFELLVRPAIRRLAGHPDDRLDRPRVVARLGEPVRSPQGKVSFLRVRLRVDGGGLVATLTGHQGSGVLSSAVAADGLAVIPAERRELDAGAAVQVVLLREDLAWVAS
jgi:molybdopterin molybdotransferase